MNEGLAELMIGMLVGFAAASIMFGMVTSSGSAGNIKQCETVGITEIGSTIIKCSVLRGE